MNITKLVNDLNKEVEELLSFVGYLRLLKAIFTVRSGKTWQSGVDDALKTLSDREEQILRKRFGIGCRPKTLDEIGREYGVISERIRQ